jgi:hypothetical protein
VEEGGGGWRRVEEGGGGWNAQGVGRREGPQKSRKFVSASIHG